MMLRFRRFIVWLCLLAAPLPVAAQSAQTPYWASLQADEVNMRVGPGEDYKILWVFHRRHLPLRVLRIKEGWRLVEDPDGARGWVLARFLSRSRGGYVVGGQPAPMQEKPTMQSRLLWRLAPGVVGILGDCADGWCEFNVSGRKGYVEQARLWGAGNP